MHYARCHTVLNGHYGHETQQHRAMKRVIARLYRLLGWLVLFEQQFCDVVAWRCGPSGCVRIVGIEAERHATRHVCVNVQRNLAKGCQRVLMVASNEQLRAALKRIVRGNLSHDVCKKVGITTIEQIERTISRLEARHARASLVTSDPDSL